MLHRGLDVEHVGRTDRKKANIEGISEINRSNQGGTEKIEGETKEHQKEKSQQGEKISITIPQNIHHPKPNQN